jgi:ClpP class serine protease
VDNTHSAFKKHVVTSRPVLAKTINKIGSGDVWLAYDALDIGLIDRIITSDEYIGERIKDGARVVKIVKCERRRFLFGSPVNLGLETRSGQKLLNLAHDARLALHGAANAFTGSAPKAML